jgi:two-component system sensor histidine kinase/response regulator
VAVAAIFGIQALTDAGPVVAFPLYLAVVFLTSLQFPRAESIAAATLAAIAILIPPLFMGGQASDMAPAVLLAAVLVAVAVAMGEVMRQSRASAADAQRRAAQASAAEQRLRAMLEAATAGLGLTDLDGRWQLVNENLCEVLGRAREEVLHLTLGEGTAENDRHALGGALAMLRAGDVNTWSAELGLVRPDGSQLPVAIDIARVPAPSSTDPALLVQLTDVSERRRAEHLRDCLVAIRQIILNSGQWEQAMPQLLDAMAGNLGWDVAEHWAVDPELQALRVRHAWQAESASVHGFLSHSRGLSVPSGVGLIGRVWLSGVMAAVSDLEQTPDADEHLRVAREAGLKSALAFPVVEGGVVTGVIELAACRPHDIRDDEVTTLVGAGVEIGQFIRRSEVDQALRRSEADHRAIYERSPIGIARISAGGELLEANPALLAMVEHDFETMRESAWPDLWRAYDQAASRHRAAPLLAGIGDGRTVQLRAATGGGRWLWLQVTATSIPDSIGRPEHVLLMVEDVTTVRETADKLAEALELQRSANSTLEKLDSTKTEFLSIVSHEFRTALTGIQGFSELIRDGGLEADEVRAYGGYIFNDADRVNRLIGDMLDLDRMESGRMTMRAGDVDINEVLSETITRAAGAATAVEFKADLDARLPVVAGDRDRLIQVVSNLVNNAIKYSPDGGLVTLSSRVEGKYALISVTDTGLGIPPDEIGHVFERFRRVRSGAAQSIPGTGLGLTIVKQIVEMHGGKIWVESAVGHGSAFHFTIPLAAASLTPLQLRHA